MKLKLLAIALGMALGIGGAGCANQREANDNTADQYEYVTGSYLPQNIQKSGPVTNGKDNLRILDQSDIQRSGGATPEQALRQLGADH